MSRRGNAEPDGERMRRILEQAESHGGVKQLPLPYAHSLLRLPPRPATSGGWEQLKFPWAV